MTSPEATDATSLTGRKWRQHIILFASLGLCIGALDLFTKRLVFDLLEVEMGPAGMPRPQVLTQNVFEVIPGFFELEAHVNYGAFKGWFQDHTNWLTGLSFLALCFLVWFLVSTLRRAGTHRLWFSAALGLLWGGTLGNLYDRAVHGHVRDFIKWFVVLDQRERVWPNFNIADSAICVGVGIILVTMFLDRGQTREDSPAKSQEQDTKTGEAGV